MLSPISPKSTKQFVFDYSIERRCLGCGNVIKNNKNMTRIYPDKCFHIICMRKMEEIRNFKPTRW
jgi:hypothetical protein